MTKDDAEMIDFLITLLEQQERIQHEEKETST